MRRGISPDLDDLALDIVLEAPRHSHRRSHLEFVCHVLYHGSARKVVIKWSHTMRSSALAERSSPGSRARAQVTVSDSASAQAIQLDLVAMGKSVSKLDEVLVVRPVASSVGVNPPWVESSDLPVETADPQPSEVLLEVDTQSGHSGRVPYEPRRGPASDPAFRFIAVAAIAGIPVLAGLALVLFLIGRTQGGWAVLLVTALQIVMVGGGLWLRRQR